MLGLRIQIAGSAAPSCADGLLDSAHLFVHDLAKTLVESGSGIVTGAGTEPRTESGRPCIFDWTTLQVIAEAPDPAPLWPAPRPERFVSMASQRALDRIPSDRREIWTRCRKRSDFLLDVSPAGWRMAGIIRERQVMRGDVLIVLGGGAGSEHLAEMYRKEGKPVIPIYAELGSVNDDGNGGSVYLHGLALAEPATFFRLRPGTGDAAARLSSLRLASGSNTNDLASLVAGMLGDLRPPLAFYVRLLAEDHSDFRAVEDFFRNVVDRVVGDRGFLRKEVGREPPDNAFINVEIFQNLHRASLVVVDLTGLRPNCTMELGYALGRRRRVVISAKRGTTLPFDEDKLPTFFWDDQKGWDEQLRGYREWFDRFSDLPPLVP